MSPSPNSGTPSSATPPPGGTTSILKLVAGITAVITLGLGIRQVVVFSTEYRARQKRLTALIATSRLQSNAGDFPGAWSSLNQALKSDPDSRPVRVAREDVAQAWLDHSRTGGAITSLSALADSLSPTLTQGLLDADSIRKADLLAHLGWADFLQWREGRRSLDPPARYRGSLALDPNNPYAHAMLGHWLLWEGDSLAAAREHFAKALSVGREHEFVRDLEIAALSNQSTTPISIELVRVADEMRTAKEQPEPVRHSLWNATTELLGVSADQDAATQLVKVVPPADLLTTFRWAFEGSGYPSAKESEYTWQLATLQELAGDTAAALAGYRVLLADRNLSYRLRNLATRAVARIRSGHP